MAKKISTPPEPEAPQAPEVPGTPVKMDEPETLKGGYVVAEGKSVVCGNAGILGPGLEIKAKYLSADPEIAEGALKTLVKSGVVKAV